MATIAFCSPYVPPELISAHGFKPRWLQPDGTNPPQALSVRRGVCPYAGEIIDAALSLQSAALVLTTACDQMRCGAAYLEHRAPLPVFLMNVPATWQTPAAAEIYAGELRRLGDFMIRCGGTAPGPDALAAVMNAYERARRSLLDNRSRLPAGRFREALDRLHAGDLEEMATAPAPPPPVLPLALIGGPLRRKDYALFGWVAQAGGRIVLDASENGEGSLPAPFDPERAAAAPWQALTKAYLAIPGVFHRPNQALFEWFAREAAGRGVRGVIFWRAVWCDLWQAEFKRLQAGCAVPLLELEFDRGEDPAAGRLRGRLEAFMETLT